ncbi:MAG: transposase [Deltaproteobacteria bacterium]|nr:transposase [Deltaproteobacteria bacterium]
MLDQVEGRAKHTSIQHRLRFGNNWGGRRKGAGPKPKGERAGVSHRTRAALASRYPVHVTMRLKEGLPNLRRRLPHRVMREAFEKGGEKFGFRLVQYSVQRNHLHFIAEAKDRVALAKGLQALFVRIARGLNRLWERKGSVFADRYHSRIMRAPRQVRNALLYVLKNCWQHEESVQGPDPYSSAAWFDGWRERLPREMRGEGPSGAAHARTWLLRVGWRRSGLLSLDSIPGAQPP